MTTTLREPQRSRITDDEIDGFRITIPIDSARGETCNVGAGLLAWAHLLFIMSCSGVYQGLTAGDLTAWGLLFFTFVVMGVGIASLVWPVPSGRRWQIVNIENDQLMIRHEGVSGDAPKAYPLGEIRNLRYSPALDTLSLAAFDPAHAGRIAFDCKGSTIRFGPRLSESESRRLIRTIKDRYKIVEDKQEALPVERI